MNLQDIKAQLNSSEEKSSGMQELDTAMIDAVSGAKGDWWVSASWTMRF